MSEIEKIQDWNRKWALHGIAEDIDRVRELIEMKAETSKVQEKMLKVSEQILSELVKVNIELNENQENGQDEDS
jgi:hypothetical protein